jgi:3-carboxy-cis,cis-muconate cycloisomerase
MPHKRNPAISVRGLACAAAARRDAGALVTAEPHQHERAAGPWHAEWDALTGALAATGGAVAAVAEALAGLEVDTTRMRQNLSITGGLIMAERVAFAAAERIGLVEAQRLVSAAAADTGGFREALIATTGLGLSAAEVDAALDPATGLESAAALVDRILEA